MKYIDLRLNDDWEHQFYSTKGRNPREIEFNEGQELNVQWPNGKRTKEKIGLYKTEVQVDDMAVTYVVVSQLPLFRIKINGLEVVIDNFEGLKFREDEIKLKDKKR
ncbi:hypothetical protein HYT23_03320 [Candidatus Pacearchaeota archaeon]|nr:hypothetical protein [Candidatus Pacearchaeota archaeon]